MQPESATARIALYSPDQLLQSANNDFIQMNPYAVEHFDYSNISTQTSASSKLISAMFSLHFGSYGGDSIRWIYFILGVAGAFLFYSGNMLWIETRIRKQKDLQNSIPVQRKDVRFLANLTIGACLGCILAIVATLLSSRWLYSFIHIESINHLYTYSYYTIFIGAMVYTFYIGHAKALPRLLLVIAIVLLAMPISSLFAYIFPQNSLWSGSHIVIVDLLAIIFGLVFLRFFQHANDRARFEPLGSFGAKSFKA